MHTRRTGAYQADNRRDFNNFQADQAQDTRFVTALYDASTKYTQSSATSSHGTDPEHARYLLHDDLAQRGYRHQDRRSREANGRAVVLGSLF